MVTGIRLNSLRAGYTTQTIPPPKVDGAQALGPTFNKAQGSTGKSFPELKVFDRNEDGKFNAQDAIPDHVLTDIDAPQTETVTKDVGVKLYGDSANGTDKKTEPKPEPVSIVA